MSRRPTKESARSFSERIDTSGRAFKDPGQGGPARLAKKTSGKLQDENGQAGQYPTYPDYYYPDDREEDTRIMYKNLLAKQQPAESVGATTGTTADRAIPYLGEAKLEERDIQYFMRKREAEELARFKIFCEQSLPRGTPWAKEFFEKINPGWYSSKEEIIDQKLDHVKRFIKIVINGVQDISDMELLYELYQGKYELPTTFEALVNGSANQSLDEDKFFTHGLFSPVRYTDTAVRIGASNRELLANFKIAGFTDPAGNADGVNLKWGESQPFGSKFSYPGLTTKFSTATPKNSGTVRNVAF